MQVSRVCRLGRGCKCQIPGHRRTMLPVCLLAKACNGDEQRFCFSSASVLRSSSPRRTHSCQASRYPAAPRRGRNLRSFGEQSDHPVRPSNLMSMHPQQHGHTVRGVCIVFDDQHTQAVSFFADVLRQPRFRLLLSLQRHPSSPGGSCEILSWKLRQPLFSDVGGTISIVLFLQKQGVVLSEIVPNGWNLPKKIGPKSDLILVKNEAAVCVDSKVKTKPTIANGNDRRKIW